MALTADSETLELLVSVAKTVYGGGYINQKMTFEDRKKLRSEAYQALKRLGLEK